MFRLFLRSGLGCGFLLGSLLAASGVLLPPKVDPADVFFLQPMLGRTPLADSIGGIPAQGGVLLPFGELCRLLAFGIRVEGAKQRAEGFFISEKRTFKLDLASGTVELSGKVHPLGAAPFLIDGQEIYLDAKALEEWFPLKVKVDLKASRVSITPLEKLPIQAEWERNGQLASPGPGGGAGDRVLPGERLRVPYAFLDCPMVDLTAIARLNQRSSSGQPNFAAAIGGDLFWMSSLTYVIRDSEGRMKDSSETLLREDPEGEMLGPLRAKRVEMGNILESPSLDLAGSLPRGRGLLVDNYPLAYRSKFAAHTFQGFLADGWSVELFQNGSLVGFQRSRADSRYEFKDVALRFGSNIYKLVFHGPFGETREERFRMDISSDQPPPGVLYYRLAGLRPITPDLDPTQDNYDLVLNSYRHNAYLVEADYGVSSWLAIHGGTGQIHLPDGNGHRYDVVGARSLFSNFSVEGSAARETLPGGRDGLSAEGIFRTGHDYSSLSLQRSEYRRGFQVMNEVGTGGAMRLLRNQTLFQIDGSTNLLNLPTSLYFLFNSRCYLDGSSNETATLKATMSHPTYVLAPSLTRGFPNQSSSAYWDLGTYLSCRYRGMDVQGDMTVRQQSSSTSLSAWSLLGNWTSASTLVNYRAGVRGTSSRLGDAVLLGAVNQVSGRYGYGLEGQYGRSLGYSFSFRLQASLGREPRTGTWAIDAKSLAYSGAVSAVAYLDANGNKTLDPGEKILEGAKIKMNNASLESCIEEPRVAFRTGLPRAQEVSIQLDEASLGDPALQAITKAYRITPRPGKTVRMDFPVGIFGSIDGTTRIRRAGKVSEVGGLEVELLDAAGRRIRVQRSAYDGFFEFITLPPGDYTLRVSGDEVQRLQLRASPERRFRVDVSKNFFDGQDLTVELQAEPQPPMSGAKP